MLKAQGLANLKDVQKRTQGLVVDFGPKASPRLGLKAYGNLWALFVKSRTPNRGRWERSSPNEGREVKVGRGKRGRQGHLYIQ